MPHVSACRSPGRTILLLATPLAFSACGGDGGTAIVLPSLTISTATSGVELDPDGYQISIDGDAGRAIGLDASLTLEQLADGQHTVALSGLAANCVATDNPQTVTVSSGATATAAFAISCRATSGTIAATTVITGVGSDPDGFVLTVDGADRGAVALNATLSVTGLEPGAHLLGLTGVAANCQVTGDNPRSITVVVGETTQAPFEVSCAAPAPSAGTIQVTTTSGGVNQDSDGYSVSVDGAATQPLGRNSSLTLSNVPAGRHAVQLQGIASNCTVGGSNPVTVTVPEGSTAAVNFTVNCVAPPSGTGSAQITAVTTGASFDDSYTVNIDGGSPQALSANGSVTVAGLTAGAHSVELNGVAPNCTVSGENPRPVTIAAGQTATVTYEIACVAPPPESGGVSITATTTGTSLDPDGYRVSVDEGTAQNIPTNGSRTIEGLTPGTHAVRLSGASTNCTVSGENPRSVGVTAGQTTSVGFTITCTAAQSAINLRIAGAYLIQSTQSLTGSVPLVQDRRAYLRVFALADRPSTVGTGVRVRFFRNGAVLRTLTIGALGGSIPTEVQQGNLNSSWNLAIDGSLIQPGVSMLVDVDPDNAVTETNENDNVFPATGTAQALTVQAVAVARIRFVPIRQGSAARGNVSDANKDQLVETAQRLFPLNQVQTDIRETYSTNTVLEPDGAGWSQVLSDIEALRVLDPDGIGRTYYGVANLGYQAGTVGLGFVGLPSAMGTDSPADVRRVMAHELGHTWNQLHTPCNNPPGADPSYPYGPGIGVYGFDLIASSIKPPTSPDIMGYCSNPWISDYTYNRVMSYRRANPSASQVVAGAKQSALLVWGRIVNGQAVLEPAFQVVTRPVLPAAPGPYSVQGVATDGSSLFSISFDAVEIADDPRQSRHFTFAVPLDQAQAGRLMDLRLTGPGGTASAASLSSARLRTGVAADSLTVQREGDGVALKWDAGARPMVMVRDPDTGEILSFARRGKAQVMTGKRSLELIESDGVQSRGRRVTVTR